jgi:tripartite-type tricarboxylate transporter receptor subunit TctC
MTLMNRRQTLRCGLAAAASLKLAQAHAQTLPDTARIFVGFPPGGAPDTIARRMADQLVGKLAKSVIVENRPGAAGRLAVDAARQAAADGNTLLLNPAGVLTINPHTYKKLNYDPFKDFTPLSLVATIDFGFAVGPAVPTEIKAIADFARWAKANPGKVNYGSPAAGSPPHFAGDVLSRTLGLDMTHVPYRGAAPMLNDLMGGQLAAGVLTLGDMVQQEKAGKLRLLAATGAVRSKFAPHVPTFGEQSVAGLDLRDWFGLYIGGTATADVQARQASMVRSVAASDSFAQALATASLEAKSSTPQELEQLARADFARWGPIVKASGFVADV